jgi:hypothetical protein
VDAMIALLTKAFVIVNEKFRQFGGRPWPGLFA